MQVSRCSLPRRREIEIVRRDEDSSPKAHPRPRPRQVLDLRVPVSGGQGLCRGEDAEAAVGPGAERGMHR